ncbi:endopeptidase La [bacterium]|nr:endopeptidase La [bacterium]
MTDNNKSTFSFVADISPEAKMLMYAHNEGKMPIISLRDNVLFPGTITPINIGRDFSLKAIRKAEREDLFVGVFTQKVPQLDQPAFQDMMPVGVVGKVVHTIKLPDGTCNALVQATNKARLMDMSMNRGMLEGMVKAETDVKVSPEMVTEFSALMVMVKERMGELCQTIDNYPSELVQYLMNIEPSSFAMNVICGYLPLSNDQKHMLLDTANEYERGLKVLKVMNNMVSLAKLKRQIEQKTQSDLDKQQKEYFLTQEMRNIQNELGNKDEVSVRMDDISTLKEQARQKKWDEKTEAMFQKELAKLERINMQSPDYNVQLGYLQTIIQLPWNECTKDNVKLPTAEKVLNQDHYGMEKVKERILEHLAVMKLRNDLKSPIICLYGPPGVGKTSLGKSIARALKRKYVRISLGGLHDESEIRGHRRTYVGAMPGRIIKGMLKAGSSNPVFILDEIDKITAATHNGDPSSAMLEVLDPEQNSTFHDNYLDMDYDLSRVLFIATANDIGSIPRPLLDRMELIEVGGYITEEKVEIAKRHLIPKKMDENGLNEYSKKIRFGKSAIEFIIERYTRESGVRGLEKQIDKLFRKLALRIAKEEGAMPVTLDEAEVGSLLGKPLYSRDKYQGNEYAGVVTGLAWTSVGGEILFIETSLSRGKGSKLTLTGNLGDVMKESAMLALEYIKSHASLLGIDMRVFDNYNIHIHVPEGAVPKDGPSAGITMATSIASALTQRKVCAGMAMTGEITLRGKVLPVGGIKEKILAAKRAGITQIVMCEENRKDVEEIPGVYLEGLTFHFVKNVTDVWALALTDEKVDNPMVFEYDNDNEKKEAAE